MKKSSKAKHATTETNTLMLILPEGTQGHRIIDSRIEERGDKLVIWDYLTKTKSIRFALFRHQLMACGLSASSPWTGKRPFDLAIVKPLRPALPAVFHDKRSSPPGYSTYAGKLESSSQGIALDLDVKDYEITDRTDTEPHPLHLENHENISFLRRDREASIKKRKGIAAGFMRKSRDEDHVHWPSVFKSMERKIKASAGGLKQAAVAAETIEEFNQKTRCITINAESLARKYREWKKQRHSRKSLRGSD